MRQVVDLTLVFPFCFSITINGFKSNSPVQLKWIISWSTLTTKRTEYSFINQCWPINWIATLNHAPQWFTCVYYVANRYNHLFCREINFSSAVLLRTIKINQNYHFNWNQFSISIASNYIFVTHLIHFNFDCAALQVADPYLQTEAASSCVKKILSEFNNRQLELTNEWENLNLKNEIETLLNEIIMANEEVSRQFLH